MKLVEQNKFDLALHGLPICAVCNKSVERMDSMYDTNTNKKRFRVYCHGEFEEAFLNDVDIENVDSIRMGKAFMSQPQLEDK
jgi:hypothetical protein